MTKIFKFFFFIFSLSFSLPAKTKAKMYQSTTHPLEITGIYQLTSLKYLSAKTEKTNNYELIFTSQTKKKRKIKIYLNKKPIQSILNKTVYLKASINPKSQDHAILSALKIEVFNLQKTTKEKRLFLLVNTKVEENKIKKQAPVQTRLIKRHQAELDFIVL